MSLVGKYEIVENHNFEEFLTSLGGQDSAEDAAKFASMKVSFEFQQDGNKYTYISTSPLGTKSTTFESGKEFSEEMLGKFKVQSVADVQGNKVTIKSKVAGGQEVTRTYEVSSDKLVVELSGPNNVKAKRVYKRL